MILDIKTKCIYGDKDDTSVENTGAISFPIFQTATYEHPEVGKSTGFDYSRLQNPTREHFQNPLDLGADIVVHSGTKFLGGHNDTLAGFVVTSVKEISEKMRFIIKTVGSGLSPVDSWLILRGIKTLGVRMEKAQENTQAIVEFLLQEPKVKNVYYPGIKGTKSYDVCKSQARGFGSMLTFEVESPELTFDR